MLNAYYVVKFGSDYYDMHSELKCQVTSDHNRAHKFQSAKKAISHMLNVEAEVDESLWRVVRCEAVIVEHELDK